MILFVGDKPSSKMKPGAKPFEGAACEKRLKEWIKALDVEEYKLSNSNDYVSFWIEAVNCTANGYKFIALGNNASKALKGISHFKLPHPSGRNRQINDKEFIAKKLAECKAWLNAR